MSAGFFITGTDTDVGKTEIAVALVKRLVATGKRVAVFKPVAAGADWCDGRYVNDDALRLLSAANVRQTYEEVNPYCFEPAIAPHIAAAESGVRISMEALKANCDALSRRSDVVICEGAGGWLVPLSGDQSMADLARVLGMPVVLVVGLRLGCLNHALLTQAAIRQYGLSRAGYVLNQIDPEMSRPDENIESLKKRLDGPCLAVAPNSPSLCPEIFAEHLDISALLKLCPSARF